MPSLQSKNGSFIKIEPLGFIQGKQFEGLRVQLKAGNGERVWSAILEGLPVFHYLALIDEFSDLAGSNEWPGDPFCALGGTLLLESENLGEEVRLLMAITLDPAERIFTDLNSLGREKPDLSMDISRKELLKFAGELEISLRNFPVSRYEIN